MITSLVVAQLVAAANLDIVFIPDDPAAPPLVVSVQSSGRARSVEWTFLATVPLQGFLADDAGSASLLPLPAAPRGSALVERDGALSLTIEDAATWQELFVTAGATAAPSSTPTPPGLPSPGAKGLRLALFGDDGIVRATLYGESTRVAGYAVTRADAPTLWVVGWSGAGVALQANAAALDLVHACGRTIPASARSGDGASSFTWYGRASAVCSRAFALIPTEGSRDVADPKQAERPRRGLVLSRTPPTSHRAAGPPSVP